MSFRFWLILFLVGIVCTAVLGYFFLSQRTDNIEAGDISRGSAGEVIILITESGFKPRLVHVQKGSQVKWVNSDKKPHSVTFKYFANLELETLSGVDQVLRPKESLSYKFEKVGEYGYFDRENMFDATIKVQ